MNNLQTLWANPHLRYSVIGLAALEILAVWLPGYKEQLEQTSKIIQLYAIAAAANSTPAATNNVSAVNQNPPQQGQSKGQSDEK